MTNLYLGVLNARKDIHPCSGTEGAEKWIKVQKKNATCTFSIAAECLLKLLLHTTNALGVENCVCDIAAAVSFFQPRNYATFNQTAQKQTVKKIKSEMEIHSRFTMHSL